MTRRRLLLLAGALALAAALLPAAPAWARPDEPKNAKKEPKDTPEGKECLAVAAEFTAKSSAGIKARIRPKGKLAISLRTSSGEYREDQAGPVLDKWFEDKSNLKAELKSVDGLTGSFKLTWDTKGSDKTQSGTLLITLEKKDKAEGYWLAKLDLV